MQVSGECFECDSADMIAPFDQWETKKLDVMFYAQCIFWYCLRNAVLPFSLLNSVCIPVPWTAEHFLLHGRKPAEISRR